jgi:glycosyltransferase involved in cell wall biosynthesis
VTISVLIPVLNEAKVLERTVPTMLAQRLEQGEIEFIFAEGNSRDGSRDVLERFAAQDARVRVLDNPSGRTPEGLNVALAHARGEYVARMDAHCFYPETYLAHGIARLERGDVAWVAGPSVPRAHGGFSGAVALALCLPLGRGPSERRPNAGASKDGERELRTSVFLGVWRRSTLVHHGGWDTGWLRAQDCELAARLLAAGERIVLLPSMAAELLPRRTLRAFVRQYHRSGHYRARTLLRHPVARRRAHSLALTPALVAALPAAAVGPRVVRIPARFAVGTYAAAVALETVHAARASAWRRRVGASRRDVALLPLAFAAMHLGFGVGMWQGLVAAGLAHATDNGRPTTPENGA